MKDEYKSVHIYVDTENNILLFPIGICKERGTTKEIDLAIEIKYPYTDEQLEKTLIEAMEKCYSLEADSNTQISPIEKYLKIKGYTKAIKDKKMIHFLWDKKEGYYLLPTANQQKKGFKHLANDMIYLGNELKIGELAKSVREAMKLSTP